MKYQETTPNSEPPKSFTTEATIAEDGTLTFLFPPELTFKPGQKISIIIKPAQPPSEDNASFEALQGTLVHYDDPFEPPIPPEDWEKEL